MRWAFVVRKRALIPWTGCADRGPLVDLDVGVVAVDQIEAGHAWNHKADRDFQVPASLVSMMGMKRCIDYSQSDDNWDLVAGEIDIPKSFDPIDKT